MAKRQQKSGPNPSKIFVGNISYRVSATFVTVLEWNCTWLSPGMCECVRGCCCHTHPDVCIWTSCLWFPCSSYTYKIQLAMYSYADRTVSRGLEKEQESGVNWEHSTLAQFVDFQFLTICCLNEQMTRVITNMTLTNVSLWYTASKRTLLHDEHWAS